MTPASSQRATIRCVEFTLPSGKGRGEGAPGQTTTLTSLQQCAEDCSHSPFHTVPSRYDNPFATCWTKPGAIPFHFAAGESLRDISARLAASNWRGAIIGPHGSGKSTLLGTLEPALTAGGHSLLTVTLRDRQRNLPNDFSRRMQELGRFHAEAPPIVIVDGYEQLTWGQRLKLVRHCRRRSLGLLITSHRSTCLPTLIALHPDFALVEQLVVELCGQVSKRIDPKFIAASHACHGSNVREIFFDLYDRYERIRRRTRTLSRAIP